MTLQQFSKLVKVIDVQAHIDDLDQRSKDNFETYLTRMYLARSAETVSSKKFWYEKALANLDNSAHWRKTADRYRQYLRDDETATVIVNEQELAQIAV